MNIFLKAYIKKNLGDDIFIKIISEKYPNCVFYLPESANYLDINNLAFYNLKYNKILKIMSLGRISKDAIAKKKCDASVMIGGSMFIEPNNCFRRIISMINYIPIFDFIIGVNFGPYYSRVYYEKHLKYFSKVKQICFREKKSYDMFSSLKNTNWAPDIIFNLDTKKYVVKEKKSVVISVINCNMRYNDEISNNYFNQILKIINYYNKLNYKICLMSFCKYEGDEEAIKLLKKKIHFAEKISFYYYDGNIEEALNIISQCSIVVGSRFHANILGLLFNKKIIPFAYSDKIINVLNDLKYNGKIYDIRKKDIIDESDLINISKNNLDITGITKSSRKHFVIIDNYLKKEHSNNV